MSLYERFKKTLVKELQKKIGCENIHQVPSITKVVVSMGIGSTVTRKGLKDFAELESHLGKITGQKSHVIKARKSVSNFKLREGQPVMLKSTLRGEKAYDFLERMITLVFPRVRDFKGVSIKKCDSHGNLNLGFKAYDIFPEIGPDDMKVPMGIQITIVTTADDAMGTQHLMETLGMPFLTDVKENTAK